MTIPNPLTTDPHSSLILELHHRDKAGADVKTVAKWTGAVTDRALGGWLKRYLQALKARKRDLGYIPAPYSAEIKTADSERTIVRWRALELVR